MPQCAAGPEWLAFTIGPSGSPSPSACRAMSACARQRGASLLHLLLAIIGVALFIALVDNQPFFRDVLSSTAGGDHRLAILGAMFLLVFTALVTLLSVAPGGRGFKLVAALMLLIAAATSYFMLNYGIIVDDSMIRNVAETDVREASPLLTASLFVHTVLFGGIPALLVMLLPLRKIGWKQHLGARLAAIAMPMLLLGGVLFTSYGPVSFFAQQNHAIRMEINPVYPLYSLVAYATRADAGPPSERKLLDARRRPAPTPGEKPLLFVLVMGETARADRFSLNGYERDTNRFTRAFDIVNFPEVSSCGTSTADSVPCIFSRFGHDDFSHAAFATEEPVFQALGRLGVDVRWRDNSTGCKLICMPEQFDELASATDKALCHDNVCIDEILLRDFPALIEDASRDRLIVMHQRGSHGPAYFTDTPEWAKEFMPECDLPSLQNCDLESINNAYDNTILYTDYFLSRVIETLEAESGRYRTAMLYVSDHGESLGEKGLFLHGLPYSLAPEEQTRVPMIFWGSAGLFESERIDRACLERSARLETSHDAIFHSLLPFFDVETPAYDSTLDLFAACREAGAIELVSHSAED